MAVLQTEIVKLEANGENAVGYLVRPDDNEQHPGVVVIQEWWGIEPHVQEVAQWVAQDGFVALVPDLYHGKVATEPNEAQKLMMTMQGNLEAAIKEIIGALDYLKGLSYVEPKKLGIMGFCMGGFLAYTVASRYPDLGAIAPFYGAGYNPTPDDVQKVTAPVMAFYGGKDQSIPADQIHKIEQLYKDAGKDASFNIYPEAGHAFINPYHGARVESAANDAWPKAISFLKQHLQ